MDRERLTEVYRKVLNCDSGQTLDALALADRLNNVGVIDDNEKSLLLNEHNFFTGQYMLLLKLLPTKGIFGANSLLKILDEINCRDAADVLSSELAEIGVETPDIVAVVPAVAEVQEVFFQKKRAGAEEVLPEEQLVMRRPDEAPREMRMYMAPIVLPKEIQNKEKPIETRLTASEWQIDPANLNLGPKIGDGGFSVVYGAIYKNQQVAIKQFITFDEFSLNMFYEEVSVMKRLHHPNIVLFVGYSHNDRCLWLVTEYVRGGAMRRYCEPAKSGAPKLGKNEKILIAQKCFCGLDYLHAKQLCHKDISPGNVLISEDLNDVKISDFGLAEFKHLTTATLTTLKGTAMYYPPEFASSVGIVRHPILSDVYSMGASLCELFSELPFWNNGGQRLSDIQVMFVLSELQNNFDKNLPYREPDCKLAIDCTLWNILQWSVFVDLNQRKSASDMHDLFSALQ